MLRMPSSSSTSKNDDATSLIGTFLLQGWVMTDKLCSEPSCSVPMMRSKDGMIQFCVLHDPLPTSNARNTTTTTTTNPTTMTVTSDDTEDDDSMIVIEPPTKQQHQQQQPEDDEFKIKQERREQSSKASQLIGQKLLQRYALLNETCPNTTCYAIPLVRHPSNKSMYCVICEQSYLREKETLSSQQSQQTTAAAISSSHSHPQPSIATDSNQPPLPPTTNTITEPLSSTTPIHMTHSPLDSPALDRSIKRQKKQEDRCVDTTTTITSVDSARTATERSVQCLGRKLLLLNDRMDQCNDPKELVLLCQSMEACAKALGACTATLEALT